MSILDKLNKISGKSATNIEDALDGIEAGSGGGGDGGILFVDFNLEEDTASTMTSPIDIANAFLNENKIVQGRLVQQMIEEGNVINYYFIFELSGVVEGTLQSGEYLGILFTAVSSDDSILSLVFNNTIDNIEQMTPPYAFTKGGKDSTL